MAHVIPLNQSALSDREGGPFAGLRQAYSDFRDYRAIFAELDALSDRELADVGLSRLNVRDVAHAAVYGH